MAVITKDLVITTKDSQGNTVVYNPYTNIDNVEGGVKSINGNTIDDYGDVKITLANLGITISTTDLTPNTSTLENGKIYIVYE